MRHARCILLLAALQVLTTSIEVAGGSGACGYYVAKRTFSETTRFLYVTGLDRSGVHALVSILEKGCPREVCVPATAGLQNVADAFVGTGHRDAAVGRLRDQKVAQFRAHAAKDAGKIILMANAGATDRATYGKSDRTSFPTPALHALAALAELAGVDLRVAVLDRSTGSIHRSLRKLTARKADVLADTAAVMSAHLNLVDPAFVARVAFDELVEDPAAYLTSDRLAFFHPDLAPHAASLAAQVRRKPASNVANATASLLAASRDELLGGGNPFPAHARPMIDGLVRSGLGARANTNFLVEKTVFSETTRFAFVAGLEGTGHHSIGSIFKNCQKSGRCVAIEKLTLGVYHGGGRPHGAFVYADETSARDVEKAREGLITAFRLAHTDQRRLVVLNTLLDTKGSGEMSYPNFLGADRALNHPDVHYLAYLAERAGVDLRILVLTRPAEGMIQSTTVHRHFNSKSVQSTQMAGMAAVLAAQLQLIDPRFYLCVPYSSLFDANWWSGSALRFSASPAKLDEAFQTHGTTVARSAWLHPDLEGRIVDASESARRKVGHADQPSIVDPTTLQTNRIPEINVTEFFGSRDLWEAHVATMAEYLHRTAGCQCGA